MALSPSQHDRLKKIRAEQQANKKLAPLNPKKVDHICRKALKYRKRLVQNCTPSERVLLNKLLELNIDHVFQQPIIVTTSLFIADFYFEKEGVKLVVEIDGSSHYKKSKMIQDKARSTALRRSGFAVIRFSNRQTVSDPVKVIEEILNKLDKIDANSITVSHKWCLVPVSTFKLQL